MSGFLELLHTDVDVRGQRLAEVMTPDVIKAVEAALDEWFDDGICKSDRLMWESHLRSALIYKTLQHLAREVEKVMSMHRDLVFTALAREEAGE